MTYYATGKIYERGPITEGQSQQGNKWQRMTLVIEVPVGNLSKKVAFQVMTGNVSEVMSFKAGDRVEVGFEVSSREYTNKDGIRSWFTSTDLRSIKAAGEPAQVASAPIPEAGPDQDDDLPFGNE